MIRLFRRKTPTVTLEEANRDLTNRMRNGQFSARSDRRTTGRIITRNRTTDHKEITR